jgi:hypothetical protein
MKDTFHRIVTRQTPNGCGQQMLLCGVASNFWGLFAGFPAEAFFFQLFHNAGGSRIANAETALQKGSGDADGYPYCHSDPTELTTPKITT